MYELFSRGSILPFQNFETDFDTRGFFLGEKPENEAVTLLATATSSEYREKFIPSLNAILYGPGRKGLASTYDEARAYCNRTGGRMLKIMDKRQENDSIEFMASEFQSVLNVTDYVVLGLKWRPSIYETDERNAKLEFFW
ncbi:hypothetical protein HELRODRAFT_182032 [Helobdella robusta]|uniref:C-type lectin domain-containing protein n=1 Tax=Helobdella robusta TaxID=6412 RepID=T1FHM1_HELRO|nr:hypothetical protein HELRODRAFT_182032 [Helobdella robusta]ESN91855.1 hypothetical protein HELRODRAFT_182032 [Helobdella robusta]